MTWEWAHVGEYRMYQITRKHDHVICNCLDDGRRWRNNWLPTWYALYQNLCKWESAFRWYSSIGWTFTLLFSYFKNMKCGEKREIINQLQLTVYQKRITWGWHHVGRQKIQFIVWPSYVTVDLKSISFRVDEGQGQWSRLSSIPPKEVTTAKTQSFYQITHFY